MADIALDWQNIRPLNGGREKGFEELCAQLARAEIPADGAFVRKGTPDAGVECYAVFPDNSEWCWQSKYFDSLGDSQWSQIDKSVNTALKKHPKLVKYFVCVPLDRPDGRVEDTRSAKDKWDEHVQKWQKSAKKLGMSVEFVYWGSHELLHRLSHPDHVGKVRFWFNARAFDKGWFKARLDEAIQTAGPRYTPAVHVDLPIARNFEAFGRTVAFFDGEKRIARTIRECFADVTSSTRKLSEDLGVLAGEVLDLLEQVLAKFAAIEPDPIGALPFQPLIDLILKTEKLALALQRSLFDREKDYEEKNRGDSPAKNPFSELVSHLRRLGFELGKARQSLKQSDSIAGNQVLLLKGEAGTGKTHLLCDVAKHRIGVGLPTVVLMGQQFISHEAPWPQALRQLDLSNVSMDEFVGALESAAQAANARALIIVDAINEGAGRIIWPDHLATFLRQALRSKWIGIVLSIRSSYEDLILPQAIRDKAHCITHFGFAEHEYDATKTYFVHYGLELPSTPLLAPEFRNPLFLKTLCSGLQSNGERRLPRGLHGITAIFELHFSEINKRAARDLDFNPKLHLVQNALKAVAMAIFDSGETALPLETASTIVDGFLPGRDFERSLFRRLIVEGLLVEDVKRQEDQSIATFIFIGYERYADHLAVRTLLDKYLDTDRPEAAFLEEGALGFLCDRKRFLSPGLLEAFCIQIPERIQRELVALAPRSADRWSMPSAFRQSLIWRASSAFSPETMETLSKIDKLDGNHAETIEAILTVSTLPNHRLNANYLDKILRRHSMPDRDAWWSVYLHGAWDSQFAIDRIVDWASAVEPQQLIEDESLDLCAISLAWMFTTSNRFLRDRATSALVKLLTGRLGAAVRLVETMSDVDDLYVVERVLAVAYGVAMRSSDQGDVGKLAECVFQRVFASGSPTPHILLRDYARGVVERAIFLRANLELDVTLARPPYKSSWPHIPTEEEIALFRHKDPNLTTYGRARNRIAFSVMIDDFARYVIGTNRSSSSCNWLSITLDDTPWKAPASPEEELQSFVEGLPADVRKEWDEFVSIANQIVEYVVDESSDLDQRFVAKDALLQKFRERLTEEQDQTFEKVWDALASDIRSDRAPRFDLQQAQRYILKRVFELGWTEERFGRFDEYSVSDHGREAAKAERIGKKYQWIAYHEILAFMSDRFQYREEFREEDGDRAYEGPWQLFLRDIDPSATERSMRGGAAKGEERSAWWKPVDFDAWETDKVASDWIEREDNLPQFEKLMVVTNSTDGSRWLSLNGYFKWTQKPPADRELNEVERRELWYLCHAYFVKSDSAPTFLQWAKGVDFWGRWMPESPTVHRMFLGEHSWSPAARYFQQEYFGDRGWVTPENDCPVQIKAVAIDYLRETGFDCAIDESISLQLPISDLVKGLNVHWSGRGADFHDVDGHLAIQTPNAHADGPSAMLVREDLLQDYLARENLSICWCVIGGKRVLSPGMGMGVNHGALRMNGAYIYLQNQLDGFLDCRLDGPWEE